MSELKNLAILTLISRYSGSERVSRNTLSSADESRRFYEKNLQKSMKCSFRRNLESYSVQNVIRRQLNILETDSYQNVNFESRSVN